MSTTDNNTLGWPSIEQFPREVAARINRFFTVADAAATVIQRARRGIRPDGSVDMRGGKRHRLHEWLLGSAVTTSVKYDGTNVGVLRDGTLLGRRTVIDVEATSYQKCDLKSMRALDTSGALEELISLGAPTAVHRTALYGELLCNNLYTYAKEGLAKEWVAFGALLECVDDAAACEFARNACTAGMLCSASDRVVCMSTCPAFADVMRRHAVPRVAVTQHTSLCAAVQNLGEWMQGEHGEGLVLTVAHNAGRTSTYKWKISREPQPAGVAALMEIASALRAGADGKAQLLDPAIHELVSTLLTVATHADSTVAQAQAKVKAPKPSREALVDVEAVQVAIASALTKFDTLEAYFDAHGQGGVSTISEQLVAELLADKDLSMPTEGVKRDAAVKEVATAVKKYVGLQFGLWKKERARHAAATGD